MNLVVELWMTLPLPLVLTPRILFFCLAKLAELTAGALLQNLFIYLLVEQSYISHDKWAGCRSRHLTLTPQIVLTIE